ncbi:MAG: universal stress protein [Granulosicoccaceae bacterium]
MFSRIVVGIDGSEASENAFRLACDIAQKYTSEIHVVHTPQPKTVAFALGATTGYHTVTTMPSEDEVQAASDKIVQSVAAIADNFQLAISGVNTERGDPADQLAGYAEKCEADLIVTGRRGLGGVGSLLLGSTTQKVSHLAKCACLSTV